MKTDRNISGDLPLLSCVFLTFSQTRSSALSNFGYEYRISKTDAPWSDTYKVVYQSDGSVNPSGFL